MKDIDILSEAAKSINDWINMEVSSKFTTISRCIAGLVVIIILYLSFDTYFNSLLMWYEYGGRNNSPLILLFIPALLFLSAMGIKSKQWFQIYNTVVLGVCIFYSLLWLAAETMLQKGCYFSIWFISLGLFIYSLMNVSLYWFKRSEVLILKLK